MEKPRPRNDTLGTVTNLENSSDQWVTVVGSPGEEMSIWELTSVSPRVGRLWESFWSVAAMLDFHATGSSLLNDASNEDWFWDCCLRVSWDCNCSSTGGAKLKFTGAGVTDDADDVMGEEEVIGAWGWPLAAVAEASSKHFLSWKFAAWSLSHWIERTESASHSWDSPGKLIEAMPFTN